MKRALAAGVSLVMLGGCSILDSGESRESYYYAQVKALEEKVDDLTTALEKAQARVSEVESDEHARFIDAYVAGQSSTPEQALAGWDAFLQDFPESPLGGAARELRDRTRARFLEQDVVETEEYRVLLDKLKAADPPTRKLLIEDFLSRFPNTSRKPDLEQRLKALGEIDALRRQYLDDGSGAGAGPTTVTPTAPPAGGDKGSAPGRAHVTVPAPKN